MKTRLAFVVGLLALAIAMPVDAKGKGGGSVSVRGYFRKDGTYVQPHHRSAPDGNFNNNWSTSGNVNPYTGEEGKKQEPSIGSGPPPGYSLPGPSPAAIPTLPDSGQETLATPQPAVRGASDVLPAQPLAVQPRNGLAAPRNPASGPRLVAPNRLEHRVLTYQEAQKQRDVERAQYWTSRGYVFDPAYTTAYMMDQKVRDMERAEYWRQQGFSFNPAYTTAYMMDQKVRDIERARHWKRLGHNFNPDYMTAYMMDQKVRDIERARHWKQQGYNFNPDFLTAYMMDQKVRDYERARFWASKGVTFNPETTSAWMMDLEARRLGHRAN